MYFVAFFGSFIVKCCCKPDSGIKTERYPYESRYEDGKLFYENEWYSKGHHIIIDNNEDSPVQ